MLDPAGTSAADLRDAVQRAREAGGASGPGGGGNAPLGADLTQIRAVLREFQAMELALRAVNTQLGILARGGTGVAIVPGVPAPLTGPAVPSVPGAPAPPSGGVPRDAGSAQMQNLLVSVLYGGLGTLGLGMGLGAAFSEVGRMISRSRQFAEQAMQAAAVGGGGAPETAALTQDIIGYYQGRGGFAGVGGAAQVAGRLGGILGGRTGAREATGLAELGHLYLGGPGGGAQFGATVAETFRSPRGFDLLASIAEYGRQSGQGITELGRQFEALVRISGQTMGVYSRSDAELESTVRVLGTLRGMPGGIGEGPAGQAQVLGGLQRASQGGLGRLIAMRAFQRATGMNPASPEGQWEFRRWQVDPEAQLRDFLPELQRTVPGSLAVQRILTQDITGWQPEVVERALAGRVSPGDIRTLRGEQPQRLVDDLRGDLGATPGGVSALSTSAREAAESIWTMVSAMSAYVERLIGMSPTGAALGMGAAAGLVGGSLVTRMRAAPRRGGFISRGRGGGGMLRAMSGMFGAGMLASDAYGAYEGDGPGWGDWAAGGIGAVVGGAMGMAGGPVGVGMGALGGYGLGRATWAVARDWLSPASAEAATGGTGVGGALNPSGWRRQEVEEHLALLRVLARGTERVVSRGTRDRSALPRPLLPEVGGPGEDPEPRATWGATATWEIPPVRGGDGVGALEGRISPTDPRLIAAARRHGLSLPLAQAIVEQESSFRINPPDAGKGAQGLTQLMPGTAREMGVTDPLDPAQNLEGGFGYFRKQYDFFSGQGMGDQEATQRAALAYYGGRDFARRPGALERETYDDEVLTKAVAWQQRATQGGGRTEEEDLGSDPNAVSWTTMAMAERVAANDVTVRIEIDPELQGLIGARVEPGVRHRVAR